MEETCSLSKLTYFVGCYCFFIYIEPSIFESGKYEVLSIAPSRDRVERDIGGAGSKLPHIENRLKYLCSYNSELIVSILNSQVN